MNYPFNSNSSADEVAAAFSAKGKKIIVTGANIGIGYETARSLSAAGAEVIFACRTPDKGRAAVAATQDAHPGCKATFKALDLSSFESIRAFCNGLEFSDLDVLICNAGLFSSDYKTTAEGIEMTVGVCHFGHFLLVNLLQQKLKNSEKGRVVMVASESHRMPARLDFDRFPLEEKDFSQFVAYGQAKLANVLFANELQRRSGSDGITACSLHPGTMVTTNIGHDSLIASVTMKLMSFFTKNANQGAATSVFCALCPDESYIAGKYFSDCRPKKASTEAQDEKVAARLWQLSEKLCGIA